MIALGISTDVGEASRAFFAADFDSVLRFLRPENASTQALLLRSRALIRLNRPSEAMAESTVAYVWAQTSEDLILSASVLAQACIRLSRFADAREILDRLRFIEWPSTDARSEFGYASALLAFCERDYDGAEYAMMNALASGNPDSRARALVLQAHIASARGQFAQHAALLWAAFRIPSSQDVFVRANLIYQLSIVAREMKAPFDVRELESAYAKQSWSASRFLRDWHYIATQNLAWYHALDGSYLRAYQLADRALALAPSPAWLATTHADYAQFALAAGERVTYRMHLANAIEIAESLDWRDPTLEGEEHHVLLDIAALLADDEPQRANVLLALYEQVHAPAATTGMAHGALAAAVLDYARGVNSTTTDRVTALKRAHATFTQIGFAWRATQAAVAIAHATNELAWYETASAALRAFPRSWLAKAMAQSGADEAARFPQLTPQQIRVVQLLRRGMTDKQIANELGIRHKTASNHVTEVLYRTQVSSRRFFAK